MSLALGLVLLGMVAGCGGKQKEEGPKQKRIAVIPKGTTHIFWRSVHAGAAKAGREMDAKIIWQGPQTEDNRTMQIEVVQNFISRGVDAIVLAPLDDAALAPPVAEAKSHGIATVIIDSGLKSEDMVSFVATDNYVGGKLAAKRLADVMAGKGKVMMLRYQVNSASTEKREQGFLDGIKEYAPNIELISTDQYGGATAGSAMEAADSLLMRFPNVDGVFCPNESTTFGMLRALNTAGKAGKLAFVGFDSSQPLVDALKEGKIHGLTVQNPFKMGYLGVKTALAALNGEAVEKRIDTGVVMVTPENMTEAQMQDLLFPDVDKWLQAD